MPYLTEMWLVLLQSLRRLKSKRRKLRFKFLKFCYVALRAKLFDKKTLPKEIPKEILKISRSGRMSNKAKFSLVFISLATLVVVTFFNNCSGMESAGSGADSTGLPSTPPTVGQLYFQSNVMPQLTAYCANCHLWSYTRVYNHALGGTPLNNTFINRMAGTNHPGGNFCSNGKEAPPCSYLVAWWELELAQ